MSAETARPRGVDAVELDPQDVDELRAEREEDAVETTEAAPVGLDAEDLEAERRDAEDLEAEDLEGEDPEAEDVEAEDLQAEDLDVDDPEAEDLDAERSDLEREREEPGGPSVLAVDDDDTEAEAASDEEENAAADVHVFDGPLPETAYVEEGNRWAGDRPVPTAGQALEADPDEPGGVVVVAEPDAPIDQAAAAGLPVVREPLLDAGEQQDFLTRWSDVQVGFVDDPLGAVRNADTLLTEIAAAYSSAFQARRDDLGSWQQDEKPDTESLRLALQRYRSFLGVILPK